MVCRKEKPDFEVKSVLGQYGRTYLTDYTFCPFCHCKTGTIIYSSKGTPETGDCWIDCSSNYIARCRTVYGEDKSCSDLIAKMRQNRGLKKQKEENRKIIDKASNDVLNNFKRNAADKTQYFRFLQEYGSKTKAMQAFEEWKKNGRK
jgi:hypothetical protein